MNNYSGGPVAAGSEMDVGLRSFMLGTYKYMIAAMGVSGVVAYFFGNYILRDGDTGRLSEIGKMMYSPMAALALTIGIMFAFGAVGRKLHTMSLSATRVFLFGFAAVMGMWLSSIAVFVEPMTTVRIFFMAAAMFGGLSLIGYTTKKDLTAIGKFGAMLFVGFIVISLMGLFFPSMAATGSMGIGLNVVGLIGIAAITAWETQGLKRIYYGTVNNPELAEKYSVYGAAGLLLAFINIFSILMSLFGDN